MKSAVIRLLSELMFDCRVQRHSDRVGEMTTYRCDSCGRISSAVQADKLSYCCGKATQPSSKHATEIFIPKSEFGTDFIPVVNRGKVVDVLLLADRTSVHTTLHACGMDMQGCVDNVLG